MVSGDGLGVVLRIGNDTYIAGIAAALAAQGQMNAFDFAVRRIVYVFIAFVVVMVPLVIVLNGLTTSKFPATYTSNQVFFNVLCMAVTALCVAIYSLLMAPCLSMCREVGFCCYWQVNILTLSLNAAAIKFYF